MYYFHVIKLISYLSYSKVLLSCLVFYINIQQSVFVINYELYTVQCNIHELSHLI
jgi:hypothetical protein